MAQPSRPPAVVGTQTFHSIGFSAGMQTGFLRGIRACMHVLHGPAPLDSTTRHFVRATTVAHVTRPGIVEGPALWSTDA
jgi:hypothetical protein